MLNSGDLPYLFNIAIMIPLIKDHKKELDDPNNLRPISISDAISKIFEMLILVELDNHTDEGLPNLIIKHYMQRHLTPVRHLTKL